MGVSGSNWAGGIAMADCPDGFYLVDSGCFTTCDEYFTPPEPSGPSGAYLHMAPFASPWGLDTHVVVVPSGPSGPSGPSAIPVEFGLPESARRVICDWRYLAPIGTACYGEEQGTTPFFGVAQALCAPLPVPVLE